MNNMQGGGGGAIGQLPFDYQRHFHQRLDMYPEFRLLEPTITNYLTQSHGIRYVLAGFVFLSLSLMLRYHVLFFGKTLSLCLHDDDDVYLLHMFFAKVFPPIKERRIV